MPKQTKELDFELFISKSLRIGVYSAGIVITLGLIMLFMTGNSGYPANNYPSSLFEVFNGSVSLKPSAIIMLGLLILIGTPVFRVGLSFFLFLLEKDYLYTVITLFVFIILVLSILFGKAI